MAKSAKNSGFFGNPEQLKKNVSLVILGVGVLLFVVVNAKISPNGDLIIWDWTFTKEFTSVIFPVFAAGGYILIRSLKYLDNSDSFSNSILKLATGGLIDKDKMHDLNPTFHGNNVFINRGDEVITHNTTSGLLLNKIQARGEQVSNIDIGNDTDSIFDILKFRLLSETDRLGANANLNLIYGLAIIMLSLYVMWDTARNMPIDKEVIDVLALYVGPRLAIVVFIEFFAFFFLRIYKENLWEIKYYQNELTNVEYKQIAMKLSEANSQNSALLEMARKLSDSDRNLYLRRAEGIKKEEKYSTDVLEILKKIASMLEKK